MAVRGALTNHTCSGVNVKDDATVVSLGISTPCPKDTAEGGHHIVRSVLQASSTGSCDHAKGAQRCICWKHRGNKAIIVEFFLDDPITTRIASILEEMNTHSTFLISILDTNFTTLHAGADWNSIFLSLLQEGPLVLHLVPF